VGVDRVFPANYKINVSITANGGFTEPQRQSNRNVIGKTAAALITDMARMVALSIVASAVKSDNWPFVLVGRWLV